MAYINDVQGSFAQALTFATSGGLNTPAYLGFTGSRSILVQGSGASGLVISSVDRRDSLTVALVHGGAFQFDLVGSDLTITFPTTATVRDLIADFDANAPGPVKLKFSLGKTENGSGTIAELAQTPLSPLDESERITDIDQLKYYYDETDIEYKVMSNVLSTDSRPAYVYSLDAFGKDETTIAGFLDPLNTGRWWAIVSLTTNTAIITAINGFVSTRRLVQIAVTADVADLATIQGQTVFVVDPTSYIDDHKQAIWAAHRIKYLAGTVNWKFAHNLKGQTPNLDSSLTDLLEVRAANGNSYVRREQGENVLDYMDNGVVNEAGATEESPLSIPALHLKHSLLIEMENAIYALIARLDSLGSKLSYDDDGIQSVVSEIAGVYRRYSLAGAIARARTQEQIAASYDGEYRYQIEYPTRAQIEQESPENIVAGLLEGINSSYVRSGETNIIKFSGIEILTEV